MPPSSELRSLLEAAGAATEPAALGLNDAEVAAAQEYAHYLRNRFTVLKLEHYLAF